MTPREGAFAGACAVLGAAATYMVLTGASIHGLQYVPAAQRWMWTVPPGTIGMDWFFRAGLSLLAAGVAYALGAALARRAAWAARPAAARLVFGLGFATMTWAALFMIFSLVVTPRRRHLGTTAPAQTHSHDD